jgi:uncharacterized protein (UPF0261 family)
MKVFAEFDDHLIRCVMDYTGECNAIDAMRIALKRYIEFEASRRLIALGGSDPTATAAPRRRSEPT